MAFLAPEGNFESACGGSTPPGATFQPSATLRGARVQIVESGEHVRVYCGDERWCARSLSTASAATSSWGSAEEGSGRQACCPTGGRYEVSLMFSARRRTRTVVRGYLASVRPAELADVVVDNTDVASLDEPGMGPFPPKRYGYPNTWKRLVPSESSFG